tara:strand:- start:409 stop:672 length:264 start_codon:yes stop_codon:yes gene_type:complete
MHDHNQLKRKREVKKTTRVTNGNTFFERKHARKITSSTQRCLDTHMDGAATAAGRRAAELRKRTALAVGRLRPKMNAILSDYDEGAV